jgi:hypothetical protein
MFEPQISEVSKNLAVVNNRLFPGTVTETAILKNNSTYIAA